jgi:hypothetical protein
MCRDVVTLLLKIEKVGVVRDGNYRSWKKNRGNKTRYPSMPRRERL